MKGFQSEKHCMVGCSNYNLIKMLKMSHPQAIQDVDEFVYFIATDLEKCSITSLDKSDKTSQ